MTEVVDATPEECLVSAKRGLERLNTTPEDLVWMHETGQFTSASHFVLWITHYDLFENWPVHEG